MKLMDMLLVGGLAALVITRTSQAASTYQTGALEPPPTQSAEEYIPPTTPAATLNKSIQQTLADIISFTQSSTARWTQRKVPSEYLFAIPDGFPKLRGNASQQFTGNTTGEYDMNFLSGTVHFRPYDPRETKNQLNRLIESARISMVGNPSMAAEFRTLANINAAWSTAYAGVL